MTNKQQKGFGTCSEWSVRREKESRDRWRHAVLAAKSTLILSVQISIPIPISSTTLPPLVTAHPVSAAPIQPRFVYPSIYSATHASIAYLRPSNACSHQLNVQTPKFSIHICVVCVCAHVHVLQSSTCVYAWLYWLQSVEESVLYGAAVVAAALWEQEPEPWETTGATELL